MHRSHSGRRSGTATRSLANGYVPKPPEREQVPPPALQGPRCPPPLEQERGHPPLAQRLPREEAAEGFLDGARRRSSQPVEMQQSYWERDEARSALELTKIVWTRRGSCLGGITYIHAAVCFNPGLGMGQLCGCRVLLFLPELICKRSHLSSACCFSTPPRAKGAPLLFRNSRRFFRTLSCTRCLASTSAHLP